MFSTMIHVVLGAVVLGVSANQAVLPPHQNPHEVWMLGSDIGTPETILTKRLRDALEAEIVASDRALPPEQTASDVIMYLPAMVTFSHGKQVFSYKAMLSDRQFHPIREVTGQCSVNGVETCARGIYRQLTEAD
jgi:hypothetical protein